MADGFLQVLGLIRWSYPSHLDAFEIEAASLDDLRAQLYAPGRLAERMFFLEHMILPCLAAQTDKNFRVVMLMGANLPEAWRAQVLDAISHVPNVVAVFEEEGQQHREVCRKVMMAHRNPKASAVAEFRLDDDDAVSLDFVAHVRRSFRRHRRLLDDEGRYYVDYPRGLALEFGAAETALSPVMAHLWVASLALVYPPSHKRSILDYPHKRLWRAMPGLSFPGPVAWLRGVHGSNDSSVSNILGKQPTWEMPPGAAAELIEERFGMDWPALQEAWRALKAASGG